jgi:hypothetical protein
MIKYSIKSLDLDLNCQKIVDTLHRMSNLGAIAAKPT